MMTDDRKDLERALLRVSTSDLRLIASLSKTAYMREVAAAELERREVGEAKAHSLLTRKDGTP